MLALAEDVASTFVELAATRWSTWPPDVAMSMAAMLFDIDVVRGREAFDRRVLANSEQQARWWLALRMWNAVALVDSESQFRVTVSTSEADSRTQLDERFGELLALGPSFPHRNCTDDVVITVLRRYPRQHLKRVILRGASGVTAQGFRAIATGGWPIACLDLSGCTGLTAASLTLLADRLTRLVSVHIGWVLAVTDATVAGFAARGQLREANFSDCPNLTDAGVAALARACGPTLRSLELKRCHMISGAAVDAVAEHAVDILSLGLDASSETPPRLLAQHDVELAVCRMVRRCRGLEELSLCNQPQVGDAALHAIAVSCRSLRAFDVSGCSGVTNDAVAAVEAVNPSLSFVGVQGCIQVVQSPTQRRRGRVSFATPMAGPAAVGLRRPVTGPRHHPPTT